MTDKEIDAFVHDYDADAVIMSDDQLLDLVHEQLADKRAAETEGHGPKKQKLSRPGGTQKPAIPAIPASKPKTRKSRKANPIVENPKEKP